MGGLGDTPSCEACVQQLSGVVTALCDLHCCGIAERLVAPKRTPPADSSHSCSSPRPPTAARLLSVSARVPVRERSHQRSCAA